jgi:hypothetical protein
MATQWSRVHWRPRGVLWSASECVCVYADDACRWASWCTAIHMIGEQRNLSLCAPRNSGLRTSRRSVRRLSTPWHLSMYVCMYVCSMYLCMHVLFIYVCSMYLCMYVLCMHSMYVTR